MLPNQTFQRCFLIAVASLLLMFIYAHHEQSSKLQRLFRGKIHGTGHRDDHTFDGTWNFTRDARNLMLTDEQCDQAFPGLFIEIDRAVEYYRKKRMITLKEIDEIVPSNGFIRGMIYDQEFYIIQSQGTFFSRESATLHAIHRAIVTSPEPLPNIEFTFLTDDIVKPQAQWAYNRAEVDEGLWLMPDFGYWAWPEAKLGSYSEVQRKTASANAKIPWKNKIGKIVWRGALTQIPWRTSLLEATKDQDWADVGAIDWGNPNKTESGRLDIDEHCQYKYVAHAEGTSNSGRMKYLQSCRSVLVAHTLNWIQHYHHLMIPSGPEQNYVAVERDWVDLEAKIKALQRDDEKAEEIAERSLRTFGEHYLTPAAETCYWRKLIRGWSKVSFEPQFLDATTGKWRGVPVEAFLLSWSTD